MSRCPKSMASEGMGVAEKVSVGTSSTTARKVARSAGALVTRYGATTVLSALTTIGLTRLLYPTDYGVYASAIAAWTVLGSTADLGTSTLLARDLGPVKSRYWPMLRTSYQVAGLWSFILSLALVALGVSAGIHTARGQAILVLAPA